MPHLYNKLSGTKIDLSHVKCEDIYKKISDLFSLGELRISSHLDMDFYIKDRGTNKLVISFGLEDWELKGEIDDFNCFNDCDKATK